MNAPTPSTSGWPGRNPSHTQTMHDARTHGHISAESSSETLRHTQVSGTETRPVNPAQNTDHELIYQRAAGVCMSVKVLVLLRDTTGGTL
jgi:hypothetical protein